MIPLAVPNLTGKETQNLQDCISSGFVSYVGPFVEQFESGCARATEATYGLATSAGTTALHLGLVVLGVRPGDLVILPSLTFIASANAISHCGAAPWLFDVKPESWTIDPEQLRSALFEKTEISRSGERIHKTTGRRIAAVMPVYTLGIPADMDLLSAVATDFGLPIIADGAAALGARYKNRNLAQLGAQLTALSFNGNKTITTGAGGALIGNDSNHLGLAAHLCRTARIGIEYDHDLVGYNYRMSNLQAAVGCAQLEQLDEFVTAKRRIDRKYREELANVAELEFFPCPKWAESACWLSGVVLPPGAPKALEVCSGLNKAGIGARPFWKPMHQQKPYQRALREPTTVSDSLWQRIVTLPCSTSLTDADQGRVIEAVMGIL